MTDSAARPPREFWLLWLAPNVKWEVYEYRPTHEAVHVIEFEAYQRLLAQCEQLAAALEEIASAKGINGFAGVKAGIAEVALTAWRKFREGK